MEVINYFNEIFCSLVQYTCKNEHPTEIISKYNFKIINPETDFNSILNSIVSEEIIKAAVLQSADNHKILYCHSYRDNSRVFQLREDYFYIDLILIKGNEVIDRRQTSYLI